MKYVLWSLFLFCTLSTLNAMSILPRFAEDTVKISNNEVIYKVTQDASHLYLSISTSESKTIMSMLHSGVTVFFDIKGKKKEKVWVKYPLNATRTKFGKNKDNNDEVNPFLDDKALKQRISKTFEKDLPLEAFYTYFGQDEKFNVMINSLDISALYSYNQDNGMLEYNLKIPKNRINSDPKKDLQKLTIGVKTIMKERVKNNEGRPSTGKGDMRSGRRGGPPNGGQGGEPQGGRDDQPNGQSPPSNQKMKPTEVLLDFWFPINN